MKFDTREDAVLRYMTVKDRPDQGDTLLRIRFTDGMLYVVGMRLEDGITPLQLADGLLNLQNDIRNYYNLQEQK
jgi:hypothetical protein